MKKVFISHPLKDNLKLNREKVNKICQEIIKEGNILPISPIHLFSFFESEEEKYREEIMEICYKLIDICDEVWTYGMSEGVLKEMEYAQKIGKPVKICSLSRNL